MQVNDLTKAIIGAAIEVHRRLGPRSTKPKRCPTCVY